MKRKVLALMLCAALMLSVAPLALAANPSARLYSIYDDEMLFAQKKEAVFSGTAAAGSVITAELIGADGGTLASGEGTAASDGKFSVSFKAPSGSFEEYTVVLRCNSVEFDRLERVVFGELWLASGQSNMQYPLAQALSAREDFSANAKQSKWIRAMLSEPLPADGVSVTAREDIPDASWVTGENPLIYSMSAVGFFFAEELVEKLGMPVGILNISLGGSSVGTWLSREAIDSDEQVKNDFMQPDAATPYIPVESWSPNEVDCFADMTANYNMRIEAVKHFRPSGIIWYQGETDLINRWSTERYARALALLQKSYTELFEYEDGLMPFIFTQLAPYFYSADGWELPEWNCGYAEFQTQQPDSRAAVTLYDLPVTYLPEVGLIHPEHKEEVGDRMAACAFDMVYSHGGCHTAAYPEASRISDGSIFVTLKNVGSGLKSSGALNGFAVCGEDGVYVQADAEIISENTVRIWSEYVEAPVSASYAYAVSTAANLYSSSSDGKAFMPVSPFVTDPSYCTQLWVEKPWTDCEADTSWRTHDDSHSAYYGTWTAENAEISFDSLNAYSGGNGMSIRADKSRFSVSPLRSFGKGFEKENFFDAETQFKNYGSISFFIRNNGTEDITFDGLRLYENSALWYSPADTSTCEPETVIPADGEWHLITLDLDRLCLWGNECGILYANDKIGLVRDIVFCFSGENADISLDHIRFAPAANEEINRFDIDLANADNIFEIISGMFVTIIGAIVNLF